MYCGCVVGVAFALMIHLCSELCNICSRVFTTKKGLSIHAQVHNSSTNKEYHCTTCQIRFVSSDDWYSHLHTPSHYSKRKRESSDDSATIANKVHSCCDVYLVVVISGELL